MEAMFAKKKAAGKKAKPVNLNAMTASDEHV